MSEVGENESLALRSRIAELDDMLQEATRRAGTYRGLIDVCLDPLFTIDPSGRLSDVNAATELALGRSHQQLRGMDFSVCFTDPQEALAAYNKVLRDGFVRNCLLELRHCNGQGMPVLFNASVCGDEGEQPGVVFASARNITHRTQIEEQLRLSLAEKEALLREIRHRVKNNMQVISSLLHMQSSYIDDEYYKGLFVECQNRIKTMSLVHEKQNKNGDISVINLRDYINSLLSILFSSYRAKIGNIRVTAVIDNLLFDVESAIPLGLVINELISNALKHAFPNKAEGQINMSLKPVEDNYLELIISDNGVGIPETIDIRNSETLGLHLVYVLIENQLGGKVQLDRGASATVFTLRFRKR
ncbi:MAG: PAS domain S-box protein [Nitrospirae bacterium]|nr:PAS domain S-box protein [Nitrospirota bacterium]MBF0591490.1 PAS domain S-box protein [Nitrospirota bacterium]